jgi:hypothetical protein
MCLIATSGIQTTTKNKTVYKRLVDLKGLKHEYYSPYQGTAWEIGVTRKEPGFGTLFFKFYTKVQPRDEIYEGIHAYSTKAAAKREMRPDEIIGKFIIPKGAQYVLGEDGEIVALEMKFAQVVKCFF